MHESVRRRIVPAFFAICLFIYSIISIEYLVRFTDDEVQYDRYPDFNNGYMVVASNSLICAWAICSCIIAIAFLVEPNLYEVKMNNNIATGFAIFAFFCGGIGLVLGFIAYVCNCTYDPVLPCYHAFTRLYKLTIFYTHTVVGLLIISIILYCFTSGFKRNPCVKQASNIPNEDV